MVLENGDDNNNEEKQLNCCADCSAKFEVEALSLQKTHSMSESTLSSLPPWLRDESIRLHSTTHDQVLNKKTIFISEFTSNPVIAQRVSPTSCHWRSALAVRESSSAS